MVENLIRPLVVASNDASHMMDILIQASTCVLQHREINYG